MERFYFIFKYNEFGVTEALALVEVLQALVGEQGWIRKQKCPVRVLRVVEPDQLEVAELDDSGNLVPNGLKCTIVFSNFYQGGKLEDCL